MAQAPITLDYKESPFSFTVCRCELEISLAIPNWNAFSSLFMTIIILAINGDALNGVYEVPINSIN